jgi:hypothetical protein
MSDPYLGCELKRLLVQEVRLKTSNRRKARTSILRKCASNTRHCKLFEAKQLFKKAKQEKQGKRYTASRSVFGCGIGLHIVSRQLSGSQGKLVFQSLVRDTCTSRHGGK